MQIGILHKFDKHTDFNLAVRMAKRDFEKAHHCAGHTATEIHINPKQRPDFTDHSTGDHYQVIYIDNLRVVADPLVKIWHIRVCTDDLTPAAELAAEMAHFDHQVRQQAA